MRKFILCLALLKLLFFPSVAFAADVETKTIAIGFRVIAKSYIFITKLDQLKSGLITRIEKMDEKQFHSWYMDFYEHVQDVAYMHDSLGLSNGLKKQEAIEILKAIEKPKMYAAVDATPDTLIANEVKRYLFKNSKPTPGSCEKEKLTSSLQCMIESFKKKYCGL